MNIFVAVDSVGHILSGIFRLTVSLEQIFVFLIVTGQLIN